ncbi:MAG: fibronectin I domain-containing protein, partial [Candidatus Saganbacteria bacterium]
WPSFKIDPIPPQIFTISNIYDGQYFDSRDVKIAWNEAPDKDLDHYELYIGTDKNNIIGTAVFAATIEASATRECYASLPGGNYWIYMRAYDKLLNFRGLDGKTNAPGHDLNLEENLVSFEIDHEPPVIAYNPNAYPPVSSQYFSPNNDDNDGKKDTTTISYSVTDKSYWRVNYLKQNEVSIEVKGEIIKDGKTVRMWTNKSPPCWQQALWDGTDDKGKIVEDGKYTIKITATDKALNTSTNESQWVAVDTTPPEIKNIVNSGIFSPNSDGEFDEDELKFDLSDNLSPRVSSTIEIIDSGDMFISRIRTGTSPVPTFLTADWDGMMISGDVAPDGKYKYKISAEDLAGNSAVNDLTNIVVDTTPPQINNLTDNIYKLQFKENYGSLDIKFKLIEASGYANVFASVLDAKGSMIQSYSITAEADKQYQVSWNGKDSFGFFVSDNSYIYYRLYAVDCVGNKKYLDSNQLVRVETPYTGILGNIIYSPDGELKIIVPQGALTSEAELSIEMRNTKLKVGENDNITLTYKLLPEGLKFNKPCQILFRYDRSKLNFAGQPVLPFEYINSWKQLSGNFKNDVFNGFIDRSGSYVIGADLTPPDPPIVNQPYTPTKSDLITVSGTAENKALVALDINGNIYTKTVHFPDWIISNIDVLEGENIIYTTAKDAAGNISKPSNKLTVIKDTTPPILNVLNADKLYLSNTVNLSASAHDAQSPTCEVWLSIKGPAQKEVFLKSYENGFNFDWSDSSLSEGTYTYVIRATDFLYNFSEKSGSMIVDKTPPYVMLDPRPINYYLSGNLELWGALDDNNFSSWILDYGAGAKPSSFTEISCGFSSRSFALISNFDTHLLPTGVYTFRLTAYDKAGNANSVVITKNIINSTMYASIFSPGINENIKGSVTVTGSISINPSEFSYYDLLCGGGAEHSSWSAILESNTLPASGDLGQWNTNGLSDGVYTLRLKAVNLGNESFIYDVPVVVDNTSPVSNITFPTSEEVLGGVISIQGTSSDQNFSQYKVEYGEGINPLSWAEIKTSQTPVSTGTSSFVLRTSEDKLADWITGSLNGIYTIRLTTTDKAGNASSSQVSFTVDNSINASLDFPPNDMALGDTIQIKGTASDINFKEYRVEYGNGSNPIVFYPIGNTHTNQVASEVLETWNTKTVSDETYTIRLVVIDKAGNEVKKTTMIIVDNTYPTVSISTPKTGDYLAGTISISGTVYDDNIQSYIIDYQDNANPGDWNYIYSTSEAQNIQYNNIFDWGASSLNGQYAIRIRAADKTGKTSTGEVSAILDNTQPVIAIASPTRESVNTGSMDINGEISDTNLASYSIKYSYGIEPIQFWQLSTGTTSQNGNLFVWPTANVKDGYYTLRFETEDKAGNKSSRDLPIIIDNSPAIAEIQEPADNQIVRGIVDIKGIACDADFTTYNFKGYEISVGTGLVPVQWTTIESLVVPKINETLCNWNTTGLSDGVYTLKLRSQDISGITEKTKAVIVDNTLPTASITSPTQGQTASGIASIVGTASDANIFEYKVYCKPTVSSTWTEIGSGNFSLANLTLATWNSILVGDGSYSIKLWVKDKAGSESEVIRDVTVNNVLAVVNDSASPTIISPNADGIDDVARINYTLSESSPVTVKIYKKPQYNTYKWEAKGVGTRYPRQDFTYTLNASGTNHPVQWFDYALTASGTRYPAQSFNWKVNGGGSENIKISTDMFISTVDPTTGYAPSKWSKDEYPGFNYTADINRSCWYHLYAATYQNKDGGSASAGIKNKTDSLLIDNLNTQYPPVSAAGPSNNWGNFNAVAGKTYIVNAFVHIGESLAEMGYSIPISASDSGIDTINYGGNKSIGVSINLPTPNGGTISGQSTSLGYSGSYSDNQYVSTSLNGSWSGANYSGALTAAYNYTGAAWSSSVSLTNKSCKSGPGSPTNYSESVSSLITVDPDVPSPTFALSGNTNSNVSLSISGANVVGSTSYTVPWNPPSNDPAGNCTPGPGIPTNYSKAISSMIIVPSTVSSPRFTLSGLLNSRVNLRFSDTGTTTTSNPDTTVIASTSYTESWNTSNDPAVVSAGWIKSGDISVPFNYDEASQSLSTNYTSPSSDIVLSGWTVNLKNPIDGTSADVILDGTPSASGSFKVKIADNLLVKTLQFNTLTSSGNRLVEWDGKDNANNFVPDGDYIYYIYAGPNIVKKSGTIKVQKSSEITSLAVSEAFISPNGDGLKDSTSINYTLSQNANSVSAAIKDKAGNTVRTISGSQSIGSHAITWNGKNDSNAIVPDGAYSVIVTAIDASGAARVKSASVTVDNNNPPTSDEDPKLIIGSPQGENKQPSWSPDGLKIAFLSDRSGNIDIWKMNPDGTQAKQITANSATENNPKWSPDGSKIVYSSDRLGELLLSKWNIWEINADGSNPIQITKDQTTFRDDNPSFSPDGKKIVYDSDQDGNFDLWTINTDGSGKSKITSSSEAETKPSWSPDGSKIAYQNQKGIGLFDVKNNNSQQLISQEGAANPSWSKDGTELLYNDNAGNIYSKPAYAGALVGVITYPILNQKLSGLVEIKGTALDTNFEGYKVEYSPNVTPYVWSEIGSSNIPKKDSILAVLNTAPLIDGEYILKLTSWDKAGNNLENSLIVNSDNDNWKLTISSLTQLTTSDAWDIEPTWSPDGSKIAFSSNRSGDYEIYIMNSDGANYINLTNNPAYDGKPKWSPDSTKITFVSDRSGNKDIWTMNSDGSNLKQLTDLTIIDNDPCWSPDSSKIAFSSNRSGNYNIWEINADGSSIPKKITSGEANDIEPSWSKWGIAFTSDRFGNKEIWMIDENGTQEAFRLTNDRNYEPCWSPFAIPLSDGSNRPLITFTSNRQGNPDIFVMDTDGVDQSKSLTDYTNTDCNPAWSPDGAKVAYASFKDGQYDVWVMNFAIKISILSVPSVKQTSDLEIISPKGGKKIENLRPTFEWYGIRGQASYKVVARKDVTNITFLKNISITEASPESGSRPAIAYAIHEFDEGLGKGTWNWKIQALDSNNNVIAETAEENFDTGAANGEGASIWTKYNDTEWDGKNGRGDMVINGIYPFEVVARAGGTTVSGRGKIAVLK